MASEIESLETTSSSVLEDSLNISFDNLSYTVRTGLLARGNWNFIYTVIWHTFYWLISSVITSLSACLRVFKFISLLHIICTMLCFWHNYYSSSSLFYLGTYLYQLNEDWLNYYTQSYVPILSTRAVTLRGIWTISNLVEFQLSTLWYLHVLR